MIGLSSKVELIRRYFLPLYMRRSFLIVTHGQVHAQLMSLIMCKGKAVDRPHDLFVIAARLEGSRRDYNMVEEVAGQWMVE